jgi:hypothetical protein
LGYCLSILVYFQFPEEARGLCDTHCDGWFVCSHVGRRAHGITAWVLRVSVVFISVLMIG